MMPTFQSAPGFTPRPMLYSWAAPVTRNIEGARRDAEMYRRRAAEASDPAERARQMEGCRECLAFLHEANRQRKARFPGNGITASTAMGAVNLLDALTEQMSAGARMRASLAIAATAAAGEIE